MIVPVNDLHFWVIHTTNPEVNMSTSPVNDLHFWVIHTVLRSWVYSQSLSMTFISG